MALTQQSDTFCTQDSIENFWGTLIANKANGEKAIVGLAVLALSRYPDGGQTLIDLDNFLDFNFFSKSANLLGEFLALATSGPLEGKYLFIRARHLLTYYLKKCSSVLGYSYIPY